MLPATDFLTDQDQPSLKRFLVLFPPRLITLIILGILFLPLWPLYLLGRVIWYRPPNVPYWSQVKRYLKSTWTVKPQDPTLPGFARVWITLLITQKIILIPVSGLAWLLDELLYGKELDAVEVNGPLFVISAARSGSTQITRYIEQDPRLAAPNILQAMFPYLWLWKLAPKTIGKILTPDKVRKLIQSTMPPELWERHETDPFGADTFDGSFYSFHMNRFALNLGPEIAREDFNMGEIAPHDSYLKKIEFINLVDRVARKTLFHANREPEGSFKRFFIKGHFLYAAPYLQEKYPDACFLTVIREPLSRLQSGINYMRVNPPDPVLGPVPWNWLRESLVYTETRYCEVEQEWFTADNGARRCMIRFSDFVNDLESSLSTVYKTCFEEDQLPAHLPREHPPRDRKNYTVNRSLKELGINEEKIRERLSEYIEWCGLIVEQG
jgi:hypothetical protein